MKRVTCINGDVGIGDFVVASPDDDFGLLVGKVLDIAYYGTPEHLDITDNLSHGVTVDFSLSNYSATRMREIDEQFKDLYSDPEMGVEDAPWDSVVMAPSALLKIRQEDMADALINEASAMRWYANRLADIVHGRRVSEVSYGIYHIRKITCIDGKISDSTITLPPILKCTALERAIEIFDDLKTERFDEESWELRIRPGDETFEARKKGDAKNCFMIRCEDNK